MTEQKKLSERVEHLVRWILNNDAAPNSWYDKTDKVVGEVLEGQIHAIAALEDRSAEAEAASKTWENEAERRSRRYEEYVVRAEANTQAAVDAALESAERLAERYEPDEKLDDVTYASRDIRALRGTSPLAEKEAELAQARAVRHVTLTARQLREALELCNPDGQDDKDQMEAEVTIWYRDKATVSSDGDFMPKGWYCHLADYPEEGCIQLDAIAMRGEETEQ